jgi:hypothetical protein
LDTLWKLVRSHQRDFGTRLTASGTSEVSIFCTMWEGRTIYFVDTPGFNDTFRSDTDVLKDIAFFLSRVYKLDIKLAGMIYLHKITDNRMGGSALKNLHMFEALCGPGSMPNIVLATTMWDVLQTKDPTLQEGIERERELLSNDEFWGLMVRRGSGVFRHDGSEASAWKMVSHIISKDNPVALAIQTQMIDEGQTLDQTDAGAYVQQELLEAQKRHQKELQDLTESMNAAIRNKDTELANRLQQHQRDFEAKIARTYEEQNKLKTDMQRMLDEQSRRHEEELRDLEERRRVQAEELRTSEQAMMGMQRTMRDLQWDMERKAQEHKSTMDQMIRFQKTTAETEEQRRKRDADMQETWLHERTLMQMRLDEEKKRQHELEKMVEAEAAEVRKTNATISLLKVVGGVALAGVGAYSGNPAIATAGLGVLRHT